MMAVWRVETLDGWDELMYAAMFGCSDSTTLADDDAAAYEDDVHAPYDGAMTPCNDDDNAWGWLAVRTRVVRETNYAASHVIVAPTQSVIVPPERIFLGSSD